MVVKRNKENNVSCDRSEVRKCGEICLLLLEWREYSSRRRIRDPEGEEEMMMRTKEVVECCQQNRSHDITGAETVTSPDTVVAGGSWET